MSIIEALGGLAIISIVIAGTVGSANYIYSLKYVMDIKTIDQHFNFIHRLLAYGNCDSFMGDTFNPDYTNEEDNSLKKLKGDDIPEIKIRRPIIDSFTGQQKISNQGKPLYEYKVLYTVKDAVLQNNQPVDTALKDTDSDTDSHISIKSMSLEKDKSTDYALFKIIFYSDKAKRAFSKSQRLDKNPKQNWKGEFERSLRIYMEIKGSEIQSCGLAPTSCPNERKTVDITSITHTQRGQTITSCKNGKIINPSNSPTIKLTVGKTPSGQFEKFEYLTDFCICSFQFYCQNGFWSDNSVCMKKH